MVLPVFFQYAGDETVSGEERRENIIHLLDQSSSPVSAGTIAKQYHVSRQVIVQDVALLRASGHQILSTYRGYIIKKDQKVRRVFKVRHKPEDTERELNLIVDCGGTVLDIFVYHRVYGTVRAKLNISTRIDVQHYLRDISSGKSTELSNVTSGYHYHTVEASNEKQLDFIQQQLEEMGFLAKLQDYEPVNFWKKAQ